MNQSQREKRRALAQIRFPLGGTRVRDWRLICDCQLHGQQGSSLLRRPFGNLLLSASIVLGGVSLPMKAMTSYPRAAPTIQREAVVEPVPPAPQPPLEPPLTLITDRVREDFAKVNHLRERLTAEQAKEELFSTRIPFGSLIYREARRNNLAPELVAAVVETESDFRPTLLSNKNAQGLMQLIPSTGRLMGATDLMNPSENVRAGTKYLRYLHKQFEGDMEMVLAAYNAGEGNVRRFGGIPPFRETQTYLERVSRSRRRYQVMVIEKLARLERQK